MNAEEVAEFLRRRGRLIGGAYPSQALAVLNLIAERDELRSALRGLLRHPGIADMDPEDKDPEDHALEGAARAALEPKP